MNKKKIWISVAAGVLFPIFCIGLFVLLQAVSLVEEHIVAKEEVPVQNLEEPLGQESEFVQLSDKKIYESDTLVCYEDRGFKKFQVEANRAEKGAEIAKAVKAFLPENVGFYVMPIPKRIMFEEDYASAQTAYVNYRNQLHAALQGVATLSDAYPSLSENGGQTLYFRTEDSWNMEGAYYGLRPFLSQVGIETIAFEEYVKSENISQFKGNLVLEQVPAYVDLNEWEDDELVYYDLPAGKNLVKEISYEGNRQVIVKKPLLTLSSRNTSSVISGNVARAIVEGDARADNKKEEYLLLIGDNDAKLLIPYLKNYYKGVYFIKISRKSGLESDLQMLIREYNVKDVLLAQDAEEFGKAGYFAAVSALVDARRTEEQEVVTDGNDIP